MNIPSDEDIALMDERLNGLKPFDGLIRDYTPVTKNDQIDALIVEFSNVLDIGHHKEGGRYLECNFKTESFKERGGFTSYFNSIKNKAKESSEKDDLELDKLKIEFTLIKKSIDDLDHKKGMRPVEKIALYVAVATSIIAIVIAIFK